MKTNPERVYAMVLRFPEGGKVSLNKIREFVSEKTKVTLLGFSGEIKVNQIIVICKGYTN